MNRMQISVTARPRKLRSILGLGSGPEGRIEKIRTVVTQLIRYERLEGSYRVLDESQGYAERLIQQACYYGPKHEETMEMAKFWLKDGELVHKLFKDLVPRYEAAPSSYTAQYILPTNYPSNGKRCVIELKGNPLPAVIQEEVDTSKWLNNVLISVVRGKSGDEVVEEAAKLDKSIEQLLKAEETLNESSNSRNKEGTPV